MQKMDTTHTRRYQTPTPTPPSPRLIRSRSGTPAISLPETRSSSLNSSQRFVFNRSKSTTKSRTIKDEGNTKPSTIISIMQKKPQESKDGFVRFLQRGSPRSTIGSTKKARSVMGSPSAWALSPGRSTPPESPAPSGKRVIKSSGGTVSGVLKYFRQKKVSPIQEEEYHQFRIFYNRLLQWRFINARGEAAIVAVKTNAKDKLFCVWLRIFKMRNSIIEKQIQVQKLKLEMKLYQIINPQMSLLNEWAKLEGKNSEAVGRVTRKLVGISVRLPLIQGAKADLMSLHESMSMAVEIMDGIEEMITKFLSQVEKILYLLTEFISTLEEQNERLEEAEEIIALVPTLLEREKSLRVHLIQIAKRVKEDSRSPKHQFCTIKLGEGLVLHQCSLVIGNEQPTYKKTKILGMSSPSSVG